jgi:hypothetical protein
MPPRSFRVYLLDCQVRVAVFLPVTGDSFVWILDGVGAVGSYSNNLTWMKRKYTGEFMAAPEAGAEIRLAHSGRAEFTVLPGGRRPAGVPRRAGEGPASRQRVLWRGLETHVPMPRRAQRWARRSTVRRCSMRELENSIAHGRYGGATVSDEPIIARPRNCRRLWFLWRVLLCVYRVRAGRRSDGTALRVGGSSGTLSFREDHADPITRTPLLCFLRQTVLYSFSYDSLSLLSHTL